VSSRRVAVFLACLTAAVLLSGCGDDEGPARDEFNEKLEGIEADPDEYELTVVSCVNDGEFIRYTWGISNLSDKRRTYAFDPYFIKLDGGEEAKGRQLVGESVGPGNYVQWDGGNGGGERFPLGDVECRFEVFDSVLGSFRDE
jgi:hypothetical protein